MVVNESDIKKKLLNHNSKEINVVASCKHPKQAESIKKELTEFDFKINGERRLKKQIHIAGRYMSDFPEDIRKKLEEIKKKGWN